MARTLTKKGALSITKDMDRLASVIQNDWKALGLSKKFAHAIAYNLDKVSDDIWRTAGIDPKTAIDGFDPFKESGYNPEDVGKEVGGPLVQDSDESWMRGEFTQQEKRELSDKVESGAINSNSANSDPSAPHAGKQASAVNLLKAADAMSFVAAKTKGTPIGKSAAVMATSLLALRQAAIAGTANAKYVQAALQAASEAGPFLLALANGGKQAGDLTKLVRLAGMGASIIAKQASDQKSEDDAKDAEDEAKKASKKSEDEVEADDKDADDEVAAAEEEVKAAKKAYLTAKAKAKKAAEEAKQSEDDGDDEEEDEDEVAASKKAHGYDLYAK